MLSVARVLSAECRYAECRHAECRGAVEDCHTMPIQQGVLLSKRNITSGLIRGRYFSAFEKKQLTMR